MPLLARPTNSRLLLFPGPMGKLQRTVKSAFPTIGEASSSSAAEMWEKAPITRDGTSRACYNS
jgi:hypothetical protein